MIGFLARGDQDLVSLSYLTLSIRKVSNKAMLTVLAVHRRHCLHGCASCCFRRLWFLFGAQADDRKKSSSTSEGTLNDESSMDSVTNIGRVRVITLAVRAMPVSQSDVLRGC
jgi:hypothetical protein